MNVALKLSQAVFVLLVVLVSGQTALAQVDWTYQGTVVSPGEPGSWDSARHQVGDVVFDGAAYHMFLIGGETPLLWDSPWSVGHWTWNDITLEWEPDPGNPVLSPKPGEWDGYSIYSIAVLHDGSMFRMWYGANASPFGPTSVGYAESTSGDIWTKHPGNPLVGLKPGLPDAWDSWGVSPNTVLMDGASYRMWFTAFDNNGGAIDVWRIGAATSADGLSWTRHKDPVLEGDEAWEGGRVYFPEVVPTGGGFQMWYSGLSGPPSLAYIGYAVSPDGVHWGKWPGNPVLSPQPGCNAVDSTAVIVEGGTVFGWVTNCFDIAHETSFFEVVFFDGFENGDTSIWPAAVP